MTRYNNDSSNQCVKQSNKRIMMDHDDDDDEVDHGMPLIMPQFR